MKNPPLAVRLGSGMLALVLFLASPVLRAEDTPGKLSKAKEKYDTDQDGKLNAEEKTRAREDAAVQNKAKEADRLKQVLAKYDADGNGQLDDSEKARIKADETAQAEKYKQSLARYDADHNGTLDRDELKKMKENEELAAKTERQAAGSEAKFQRRMQKMRGQDVPKQRKR